MRNILLFIFYFNLTLSYSQSECFESIPARCGTILENQTTIGAANNLDVDFYNCNTGNFQYDAPDLVYSLTIFERQNVRIVLDIHDDVDLDLFLLDDCSPLAINCIAGSQESNNETGVRQERLDVILEAGEYYVVVDGDNVDQAGMFSLEIQCQCNCLEEPTSLFGRSILCEDFLNYENTDITNQSTRWRKWEATSAGANIEGDDQDQVLRISPSGDVDSDIIYRLNDLERGRHRISWRIKLDQGSGGYYNILHRMPNIAVDAIPAFEVVFDPSGFTQLLLSNGEALQFNYITDAWNEVMHIIDQDQDIAEMWFNGNFIHSWRYSSANDESRIDLLGGINFYARQEFNFLIGNICVWEVDNIPNCIFVDPRCVNNGVVYRSECEAGAEGLYTPNEWTTCFNICDFGNELIFRDDQFSGSFDENDVVPPLLYLDDCLLNAYGGVLPQNIKADIKVLYNDEQQAIRPGNIQSTGQDLRIFIFQCITDINSGLQGQINLGEINLGGIFNPPGNCIFNINITREKGTYYIVTLGPAGSEYSMNVLPGADCQFGINPVSCNTFLVGETLGNRSNYDLNGLGDYQSCYSGLRSYEGNDKVYKLEVLTPSVVNIELSAVDQKAVFLYNFLCAKNCIGYAETPNEGGSAMISQLSLEPGNYYLVVDSEPAGASSRNFDLLITCLDDENFANILFGIADEDCPIDQNELNNHEVRVVRDAYPVQSGAIISFGFEENNQLRGVFTGRLENNSNNIFQLQRDEAGGEKCAFGEGDELKTSLYTKTNGNDHSVIVCEANYLALVDPAITAQGNFSSGKKSTIRNLKALQRVQMLLSTTRLSETVQGGRKTVKIIAGNTGIEVVKDPTAQWFTFQTIPENDEVLVNIQANPFQSERKSYIDFKFGANRAFTRRIPITQAGQCIAPTVSISRSDNGQSFVCAGESFNLTAAITGGDPQFYDIVWSTGATGNQITIGDITSPETFGITVTEKSCLVSVSASIDVNVESLPMITTTPDTTICSGDELTLRVDGDPSFTYNWEDIGQGQSITITPNSSKRYGVTATNAAGCITTTEVLVLLEELPVIGLPPDTTACIGERIMVTAHGDPNHTYLWTPGDQIGQTIEVEAGLNQDFQVQATSPLGCISTSTITVSSFPEIMVDNIETLEPTSENSGFIRLQVSGGEGPYEVSWTDSLGNQLQGDLTLQDVGPGCYTAQITDQNNCQIATDCIPLTLQMSTSTIELTSNVLHIYPNPAVDFISIHSSDVLTEEISFELLDLFGRRLDETVWLQGNLLNYQIDVSSEPQGLYLLVIKNDQSIFVKKVIKH